MTREQQTEHRAVEAFSYLKWHKIPYSRPLPSHIKIGPSISYWPASGKAFVDGDKRCHPERGLRALGAVLRSQGDLSGPSAATNQPWTDAPNEDTIGVTIHPD